MYGSCEVQTKYPGDEARLARLSLIEEGPEVCAYGAPSVCGQSCC